MINSFWNICSTCPMPKEEKLNSEYRRNYVWHPLYKPLPQDVISCAPQSVYKEIGIQRKKQYPGLAYRSHELIRHDIGHQSSDVPDSRARSEERNASLASKAGPRSRSAEPGLGRGQQKSIMVQSFPPVTAGRVSILPKTVEFPVISEQSCEVTEYKSQFAWPKKDEEETVQCFARKSVSMNVIRSSEDTVNTSVPKTKLAPVHRPCVKQKELAASQDIKKKVKTEYKAKYKPFTSYVYVDGEWKKTSRLLKVPEKVEGDHVEPWLVEVSERLQRANEYRIRGHGHPVYGEVLPEIYKQPSETMPTRGRRTPVELHLNLPKCHESSKRNEIKRRESQSTISQETKSQTEPKKKPLRRPKSAEPAKAKETVKYKHTATTPPARFSTAASQSLPTKKRMPKLEEVQKIPKSKGNRKLKEEVAKTANSKPASAGNKKPLLSSSSEGKVWLQTDPPVSSAVKEHSDAVRPSSLSPIRSTVLARDPPLNNQECQNNDSFPKMSSSSVVALTHVKTPEEVTGVKSPDPENWTVPIENSEQLEWSGVNTSSKIPSKISKATTKSESDKEELTNFAATETNAPAETQQSSVSAGKTSSNVLDRARSRLDQFWGKNK